VLTTLIIDQLHENRKRLQQSLLDLQRTESQLEMIDANVPEAIFTAGEAGFAEHLNGFFAKYTGRELHSLIGAGWLDSVHPDDRNSLLLELSSRQKETEQFERVIRLRRSDGAYRTFKCHARRKQGSDENTTWFGICSDIQNEKALASALEIRTQELVRLNESLERFAYAASHDLQEPLRTVGALTELFLSRHRGEFDSDSSAILASVVKGTERMKRLIGDIMELARTANSATENAANVDLRAIAESAIANLGQAIDESGAMVDVDDLPTICANETAMLRLFQNIIANAIKYRSEKQPKVHISAVLRDGEYAFSITDNGIGIDPEYCDKIFEPFRRLHGQSHYEGSGLGLAACRRIVQALNGRIWVESNPGEGSTFFFTIPKHSEDGAAVNTNAPHSTGHLDAGKESTEQGAPRKSFGAAHGVNG
jgi:PAS domain S-box-containing protein